MRITPRPQQVQSIDLLKKEGRAAMRSSPSKQARLVVALPTGGGKTYLAAFMMQSAMEKGNSCIFIVDRLVLIPQVEETLASLGIPHTVLQGDRIFNPDAPVWIASAQTLERRKDQGRLDRMRMPSLAFVDECHTIRAATNDFLSEMPRGSMAVGLSATPFSQDLSDIWQGIINVSTTDEMVADGTLCRLDPMLSIPQVDMSKAKGSGEWTEKQAEEGAADIIGHIPDCWADECQKRFGGIVPTIAFVPSVDYGAWLTARFNEAGVPADNATYKDTPQSRMRKIQSFRSGETMVLCAVECLAKGFDVPQVGCIIDARARKKSFEGYAQAVGRGMRAHPSKDYCLLLDFAGNWPIFASELKAFHKNGVQFFGQYTNILRHDQAPRKKGKKDEIPNIVCTNEECQMVFPAHEPKCPACGHPNEHPGFHFVNGKLVSAELAEKAALGDVWPDCCTYAIRHYNDGDINKAAKYARALHKNITGEWPEWGRQLQPADDVRLEVAVLIKQHNRKFYARKAQKMKLGFTPSNWKAA